MTDSEAIKETTNSMAVTTMIYCKAVREMTT